MRMFIRWKVFENTRIAGELAVCAETMGGEPGKRVEPVQGLSNEGQPVPEDVSTLDVGQLVKQYVSDLCFGEAFFKMRGNENDWP